MHGSSEFPEPTFPKNITEASFVVIVSFTRSAMWLGKTDKLAELLVSSLGH